MKKKNLVALLVVAMMSTSILVGCGGSAEEVVDNVAETVSAEADEEVAEATEVATTEESAAETTETAVAEVEFVDDGTFYGLPIWESGMEHNMFNWMREVEVDGELRREYLDASVTPIVETIDNGDGTTTKNVTYIMKTSNVGGDFLINVFDYKTHEDLFMRDDFTASMTETSLLENGIDWTFTVTVTAPNECDPVITFTQNHSSFTTSDYDVSALLEEPCDFQKFLDTSNLDTTISQELYLDSLDRTILIVR